jgi:OmpA-OmpF porin, OOP family
VLNDCPIMLMEIAGHTDAQGSEGGNQALSQARADAVLLALQGRRVEVSGMRAVGYGETRPIADNDTDAGREANRRIEFTLLGTSGPATALNGQGGTTDAPATGEGVNRPSFAPTEPTIRPKPRPDQG